VSELQTSQKSELFPFLLTLILCLAWLFPGLIGHEPWKGDEAVTMGLVHSILSGSPASIPVLAGEPWPFAPPPLYPTVAAVVAAWLAPWLPAHDGARLAAGGFVLLAFIFAALTGHHLYGRRHGRMVVMVLIGSTGLWFAGHESIPQSALLLGAAMTGYGAALSPSRPYTGGIWAGCGLGISFMSSGIVNASALGLSLLLLPVLSPAWRSLSTLRSAISTLTAVTPWLLIWPWQFRHSAPEIWQQWLTLQLNQFVFFGIPHASPTPYYLVFLPWFAWPAWPLALWTLWQSRRKQQFLAPGIALPSAVFMATLCTLSLTRNPDPDHGLTLLLPLAWLASGGTGSLRRGAANALYWFAIMAFGVLGIAVWVYWSALDLGIPAQLAHHLHSLQPRYNGSFRPLPVLLAIAYCLLWIILLLRMKRSPQRPLLAWAAGMTMAWGLAAFLFVAPMDQRLGYGGVAASLQPKLPALGCVAGRDIDDGARAMMDYYIGLQTLPDNSAHPRSCHWLLTEDPGDSATPPTLSGWHAIWSDSRMGNRAERFTLYHRIN